VNHRQHNIENANFEPDNAEAVHGMPVSLQLVANRLEEEKVVAMTRVVLGDL
jgi:Asp-tRNA(Asn)/Glu-tRNA(Gln) amidotransferase A subunit family amidase